MAADPGRVSVDRLELVEFGPEDDAAVEEYVRVAAAIRAVDAPWSPPLTPHRLRMEMRHGWDGEPARFFRVRLDGAVVGSADYFGSEYDNHDLAWVHAEIAPEHRGRGHGHRLLAAVEDLARADGRPMLTVVGWDSPEVVALAASAGYRLGSIGVHRVQELDGSAAEADRFGALRDEAAASASGYEILRLDGVTPEDLLDGVVRVTAAINDSPHDQLEYADEIYDAARVRAYEEAQRLGGFRMRRVIAVSRATGEVAGHTVISVDAEQPAYAEQHFTAVVPEHRGHRLGLLLKAEMLCWLAEEEPELRSVHTANAGTNAQMIAVNELLGYRIAGRRLLFQRRLDVDQ